MAHELKQHEIPQETIRAGHEPSVVNLRVLTITALVIVVVGVVVHIMLVAVFGLFNADQARREAQRQITSVVSKEKNVPAEGVARLQGVPGFGDRTPRSEMADWTDYNKRMLSRYAESQPGRVRVPIEQAMELALQRNMFPARAAAPHEPKSATPGGAHDSE